LYIDCCENLNIRHLDTDGSNAENMIRAIGDGAVELYHDNSKKLETISTGVVITGSDDGDGGAKGDFKFFQTDGTLKIMFDASTSQFEFLDNSKASFGNDDDLKIYHDSNNSAINHNGTGDFYIQSNNNIYIRNIGGDNYISAIEDGAVELYHDNVKTIETNAGGITLPSEASGAQFRLGAGSDFQIEHDGTNSYIYNLTNDLLIQCDNNVEITAKSGGTKRFRFDSDGLKFGTDTAAANALDDYEEGTFTPAWNGGNGNVSSITYGTNNGGSYTKIGNLVTVTGKTDITASSGGSGFWYLGNMPFVVYGGGKSYNSVGAVSIENFNMPDGTIQVVATMEQNNNNMHLHDVRDNQSLGTGISINNDGAFSVQFAITYRTT